MSYHGRDIPPEWREAEHDEFAGADNGREMALPEAARKSLSARRRIEMYWESKRLERLLDDDLA